MPTGHAMLPAPNIKEAAGGHVSCIPSLQSLASGGTFRRRSDEIQAYSRAALRRLNVGYAGGQCSCAGQDRQDRRDFSLEWQCRFYRRPYQSCARSRDGYYQQRPSRTRHFSAGQECRACGPWRRQGRSGVRRQPGQPRHRTKPGAAADHRREGGRAHRRLSIRHHTDRQRDFRKIRNSLSQRRVGGRQFDRARLQMVFPHNAGRHRLRQNLQRLPQGYEGGRREDRYGRHGA